MNASVRWVSLTHAGTNNEKVHLRSDTIVGVRPCGSAAYGANVDVSTAGGNVIPVEESVEQVWKLLNEGAV